MHGYQQLTNKLPALVPALLLLAAVLGHWPYGFYTLMRPVVCGFAIYLAMETKRMGCGAWTWIMGVIAVLFNPIVPMRMHRSDWQIIDLATAIVLLIFVALDRRQGYSLHYQRNTMRIAYFLPALMVVGCGLRSNEWILQSFDKEKGYVFTKNGVQYQTTCVATGRPVVGRPPNEVQDADPNALPPDLAYSEASCSDILVRQRVGYLGIVWGVSWLPSCALSRTTSGHCLINL